MLVKVLLRSRLPGWQLHSLYRTYFTDPPEGYSFEVESGTSDGYNVRILDRQINNSRIKSLYDYAKPIVYYAFRSSQRSSLEHFDLEYCSQFVSRSKTPWIVDFEFATALAGYGRFGFFKKVIRAALASRNCIGIIPWTKIGMTTLLNSMDCRDFEHKIQPIHLCTTQKKITKKEINETVTILFVGTGNNFNIPQSFELKGGPYVLAVFDRLTKSFSNIRLTIRSKVPSWVKAKYAGRSDVEILDRTLSPLELEKTFLKSDIFLFPGHQTPGMIILEAMSYALPVVCTDVWANSEIVSDGVSGYLVPPSSKVQYFSDDLMPLWGEPLFYEKIQRIDLNVIENLVSRLSQLVTDQRRRLSMGKAGQSSVESGNLSLTARNSKLRKLLSEQGF